MLTRASEIEEIAGQQKKLEQKATSLKEQYSQIGASIEESEKESEALSSELSLISVLFNSEKSNLTMLDSRIREESANLQSLNNASGHLDEVEAEKLAEAAALRMEETKLSGQLEEIASEIQTVQLEKNRTAKLLEDKISEKNSAIVTISIQTKELERITERIDETKSQIGQLSDDLLRSTERQNTAMNEQKELTSRIADNEILAASLNEEIGNIKSKGKSLTERSLELEKQSTALRQSSREKAAE